MSTAILPEGKTEYLINNLDRAISEGWIEIYTQPVVRSSNGKVTIAAGTARSSKGLSFNDVFNQADTCMYEKKKKMKQL